MNSEIAEEKTCSRTPSESALEVVRGCKNLHDLCQLLPPEHPIVGQINVMCERFTLSLGSGGFVHDDERRITFESGYAKGRREGIRKGVEDERKRVAELAAKTFSTARTENPPQSVAGDSRGGTPENEKKETSDLREKTG
jgi:hypothetical protein